MNAPMTFAVRLISLGIVGLTTLFQRAGPVSRRRLSLPSDRHVTPVTAVTASEMPKGPSSARSSRMDSQLQKMWEGINQRHFDDELKPLAAVDWDEISGENGIGAHGLFFPKSRCIVIDENFRFDEEAIRAGDEKEKYKAECAYLLLIHEMVHQVLYQRKAPQPGARRIISG
jgi:hypothetical protein